VSKETYYCCDGGNQDCCTRAVDYEGGEENEKIEGDPCQLGLEEEEEEQEEEEEAEEEEEEEEDVKVKKEEMLGVVVKEEEEKEEEEEEEDVEVKKEEVVGVVVMGKGEEEEEVFEGDCALCVCVREREGGEGREREREGGERESVRKKKTVGEFEFAHTSHTTIEVAEVRNIFENELGTHELGAHELGTQDRNIFENVEGGLEEMESADVSQGDGERGRREGGAGGRERAVYVYEDVKGVLEEVEGGCQVTCAGGAREVERGRSPAIPPPPLSFSGKDRRHCSYDDDEVAEVTSPCHVSTMETHYDPYKVTLENTFCSQGTLFCCTDDEAAGTSSRWGGVGL
jgi:hypothetical protein